MPYFMSIWFVCDGCGHKSNVKTVEDGEFSDSGVDELTELGCTFVTENEDGDDIDTLYFCEDCVVEEAAEDRCFELDNPGSV